MKINYFLIALTIILSFSCKNNSIPLYIGTYTDGESEGIYSFKFNMETGELINKTLVAKTENPSFITYAPNKDYIYAVNENENGSVSAFKVNSNSLTLLNKVSSKGAHPCHISINETGNKAVVSNYSGGNFSIFNVKNNGELSDALQVLEHNTDSIVSHAHSAQFLGDDLYAADLGKNGVYQYQLVNGTYREVSSSIVPMHPNSGPRHFAITKDGNFIYIINELSSTITSGKKTKSGFEPIETLSTLAHDFNDDSYCADIHLSADEQFLYGSNRGENSIVVFKREPLNGTLEKIQNTSVHGDWPRNFTLDPTGKFLLVANQRSHNITVFSIDQTNGTLTFLQEVKMDSPVCLLF
ncbi:lactonase family protein [Aestuariivivens marinum]|uniref:lactonase family protein n=1 Tax=Aestuariivivens marinum TaxID=2913555 RepID=UPI001F5AC4B4|nr:lactonase family protein [Aestuariivivens marinum]